MDSIKISTGEYRIPVERDGSRVGEIAFNPSDVVFAEKFYRFYAELEKAQKDFQERGEKLDKNTALDEVGVPININERLEYLRDVNKLFRSQIDELFGVGTSQMVFGDYLSYDMDVYIQFFEGVSPLVQKTRADKIAEYTTPASAKRNKRK
jgi:hypothetical protein